MTDDASSEFDGCEIDPLLTQDPRRDAAALLPQPCAAVTPERHNRLVTLLRDVRLHGPQEFEDAIDELRGWPELTAGEKDLIRQIFLIGYQAAEAAGNHEQTWAYQRLLRRLLLGVPLNHKIPATPRHPPANGTPEMASPLAASFLQSSCGIGNTFLHYLNACRFSVVKAVALARLVRAAR
jgi:hypothetical protein